MFLREEIILSAKEKLSSFPKELIEDRIKELAGLLGRQLEQHKKNFVKDTLQLNVRIYKYIWG